VSGELLSEAVLAEEGQTGVSDISVPPYMYPRIVDSNFIINLV